MPRPSSAERARRLIALLNCFRGVADQRIPLSDLAETLGVPPATIERDLELLSMCASDPADASTAVPIFVEDGFVQVFGDMPRLRGGIRLSVREARALSAALESAGFGPDDAIVERIATATSAPADRDTITGALRAETTAHDPEIYKLVTNAEARREVIEIDYLRGGAQTPEARSVEPLVIYSERGVWYVGAYCRSASAIRTFRLDRIREVRATGERFEPRDVDPQTFRAFDSADLPTSRLVFADENAYVPREWPGSTVAGSSAEGLLVDVPYGGTAWIARQVVARLGSVRVTAPEQVRAAVADLARAERAALGRTEV